MSEIFVKILCMTLRRDLPLSSHASSLLRSQAKLLKRQAAVCICVVPRTTYDLIGYEHENYIYFLS